MHFNTLLGKDGEGEGLVHAHHLRHFADGHRPAGTLSRSFEVYRGRKHHHRGDVVLLVGEFNEVNVLALLNIVIVDDDDGRPLENFSAKRVVVFLPDLDESVRF